MDTAIHSRLVRESPSQREQQRLTRLLAEHAGAWVTAVPSSLDGSDCCMSPQVFRTAVRYRLGMRVSRPGVRCSFCTQSFDESGDHAACCKSNSDIIVRHNRLRNLLFRFAEEGLLSPVLEKRFILGECSGRRPGDVTIPCWKDSKALAVDVAVTSSFSKQNLGLESPADSYGLRKHQKYDQGFRGTDHLFCATVLETTGAISKEGVSFLRQLFRFAARQQNSKLCVYAGRAWARLSCNLQTSVAQAILHRVPTGGRSEPRVAEEGKAQLEPCSQELWEDAEGGGEGRKEEPEESPLAAFLSPFATTTTATTTSFLFS